MAQQGARRTLLPHHATHTRLVPMLCCLLQILNIASIARIHSPTNLQVSLNTSYIPAPCWVPRNGGGQMDIPSQSSSLPVKTSIKPRTSDSIKPASYWPGSLWPLLLHAHPFLTGHHPNQPSHKTDPCLRGPQDGWSLEVQAFEVV